jgi:hypothetical protein
MVRTIGLVCICAFAVTACDGGDDHHDGDVLDTADDADGDNDGDAGADADGDADADADADADDGGGDDGSTTCPRTLAPADRPRKVVVSHPYDSAGNPAGTYEVLDLAVDGTPTRTAATFDMGRTTEGEIAFTPDGEVGLVVQEDGTLGVFRFETGGVPVVVDPGFAGTFYAARVVMDPSGERAWVLDTEWRAPDASGGIYAVAIGCDGTPTEEGLVAPAKLPYAFEFVPTDPARALVVAYDILDVTTGPDVHLLRWDATPEIIARADAFPADDEIVSSMAITFDGRYALVADNGMFTDPNRIAVVELAGDTLRAVGMVSPMNDPVSLFASPWNNAALVASGYGNAVIVLDYDPGIPGEPFVNAGEPAYAGASPQLPSSGVLLDRGSLRGLVLLAELSGVRRFRFEADGTVTDLGLTDFGSGLQNIVGAIGVQP